MLQQKTEGGQQHAPAANLLLDAVGTACPGLQQCSTRLRAQHLTAATMPRAATAVTASWVLMVMVPSDRAAELLLLAMLGCRQRHGLCLKPLQGLDCICMGSEQNHPLHA